MDGASPTSVLDICTTVYGLPISQCDVGGAAACTVCACFIGAYCAKLYKDADPKKEDMIELITAAASGWSAKQLGFLNVEETLYHFDSLSDFIAGTSSCAGLMMRNRTKDMPPELRAFNLLTLSDAIDTLVNECDERNEPVVLILTQNFNTICIYIKENDSSWVIDTHRRDIYTGLVPESNVTYWTNELSAVATHFRTRERLYKFLLRLFGEYNPPPSSSSADHVYSTVRGPYTIEVGEGEIVPSGIEVPPVEPLPLFDDDEATGSATTTYSAITDVAKYQFTLHALSPRYDDDDDAY